MGRTDTKQTKIPFEARMASKAGAAENTDLDMADSQEEDWKALLLSMKNSLTSIDTKMDAMNSWLDSVVHKLDQHDQRLKEVETRVSDLENGDQRTGLPDGQAPQNHSREN